MATFLYKTKENTDPKGKPRVYFTCHPEDFQNYFEKIKDDIFATHDVAIYYTEDMSAGFDEADLDTALGQMNLFVVPVTYRLLSQPSRALEVDIAFAKQQDIPILPFMMESGIDDLYSKPENFGERQYLNPHSADLTEVRYTSKLKQHLESVLISDELAKRIRAAFDAYIFLSYRKKDRRHANALMKLIHQNPAFRDIAIWYDEFLTPGESFAASIQKALESSKFVTLLVTPNLLEEPGGKPNFVMAEEYPAAVQAGKEILPAEMVQTDHAALTDKFKDLPSCADPQDAAAFNHRLLQAIQRVAITANDHEPEHNFLIGLAYLEGIDMEVNRARGIELITSAAESGLIEAMKKLYDVYSGNGAIAPNYPKAEHWARQRYEHCVQQFGPCHAEVLQALTDLANIHKHHFHEAKDYWDQAHNLACQLYGEEDPASVATLIKLADAYIEIVDNAKALELYKKAYALQTKRLGTRHLDCIHTLCKIAATHGYLKDHANALQHWESVYALQCAVLGDDAPDTLRSRKEIAAARKKLGHKQAMLEYYTQHHQFLAETLGAQHPQTLEALSGLATACRELSHPKKAAALHKKIYELRQEILGATHPDTIEALQNLALCHEKMGNNRKTLQLYRQIYDLLCQSLGEAHPKLSECVDHIMGVYYKSGQGDKVLAVYETYYTKLTQLLDPKDPRIAEQAGKVASGCTLLGNSTLAHHWREIEYNHLCDAFGESGQKTLQALQFLGMGYMANGDFETAAARLDKWYATLCQTFGEEHSDSIDALQFMIMLYDSCAGYDPKLLELREKEYHLLCKTQGPTHDETVTALQKLAEACVDQEEYQKAGHWYKTLWQLQCRLLGYDHPDALQALKDLIAIQKILKQ